MLEVGLGGCTCSSSGLVGILNTSSQKIVRETSHEITFALAGGDFGTLIYTVSLPDSRATTLVFVYPTLMPGSKDLDRDARTMQQPQVVSQMGVLVHAVPTANA